MVVINNENEMSTYLNFAAALTAGLVSELTVLPICTIQTVYQTQDIVKFPSLDIRKRKIYDIIRELYTKNGIKAFYNASLAGITCQTISMGTKFSLYKALQDYRGTTDLKNNLIGHSILSRRFSVLAENMFNGCITGMAAVFLTQPFDTMKNYHQRQLSIFSNANLNKTTPDKFKPYSSISFYIKRLYKGLYPSMFKSGLLGTLLFPVNDFMSQYIANPFFSGLATSLVITPIIHPLDLLKRRAMAGQKLWLGCNPKNYYLGLHLNYLRSLPHFSVSMYTIHLFKDFFSKS